MVPGGTPRSLRGLVAVTGRPHLHSATAADSRIAPEVVTIVAVVTWLRLHLTMHQINGYIGLSDYQKFRIGYQAQGYQTYRANELSDYGTNGLSGYRTVGMD